MFVMVHVGLSGLIHPRGVVVVAGPVVTILVTSDAVLFHLLIWANAIGPGQSRRSSQDAERDDRGDSRGEASREEGKCRRSRFSGDGIKVCHTQANGQDRTRCLRYAPSTLCASGR